MRPLRAKVPLGDAPSGWFEQAHFPLGVFPFTHPFVGWAPRGERYTEGVISADSVDGWVVGAMAART